MIKLLVSDLDGTLLTERSLLSPTTIEAVHRLQEQGIYFALATGRLEYMAHLFYDQLQLKLPLISCNGAKVAFPHGEVLSQTCLPSKLVYQLYQMFMELDLDFLFYTNDGSFSRRNGQRVLLHHYYNQLCKQLGHEGFPIHYMEEYFYDDKKIASQIEKMEVLKFFVKHKDEKILQEALTYCRTLPEVTCSVSCNGSFDLMAKGVSKAKGVQLLAEYCSCTLEEVACFGDQENDMDMLSIAGISYAMKNADLYLQKRVKRVAEANRVDGVARAIYQDFL